MGAHKDEQIDELASDLDDLKTTVEELEADPPDGLDPASLRRLEEALGRASDVTNELEDQSEDA